MNEPREVQLPIEPFGDLTVATKITDLENRVAALEEKETPTE